MGDLRTYTAAVLTFFSIFSQTASPSYASAIANKTDTITGELLQMIWSLLLVIALILLIYAFLRKRFSITGTQADKTIKIIEMRPLPGKKSLCLIEVEGERLLIGLAENSINVLTNLSGKKKFDQVLRECNQQEEICQSQPLHQKEES